MHSAFTQPPHQEQSNVTWYHPQTPLNTFPFQDISEPQYHPQNQAQVPHISHTQQQQQQHIGSPTYQYQQHQNQCEVHENQYQQQHVFQVQQSFESQQYLPHHSATDQHQQAISPQVVQSEAFPSSSTGISWGSVEYDDKNMIADSRILPLHSLVVSSPQLVYPRLVAINPNVIIFGGDDNESVEGTDEYEVRKQLSESRYYSLSATPPLSPHATGQISHSHVTPQSLVESLAGLSTSSPIAASFAPSPILSIDAGLLFPNETNNGSYGHCDTFSVSESKNMQDKDEDDKDRAHCDISDQEGDEIESRPFRCEMCEKNFRRQYNLNAHLKTHLEERVHACNQCDKKFLRPYDLSRHQRIHTKDKPYQCKICSQIFIRNDAIWRHYRKIHQDHPDVPTSRRDKKKHTGSSNVGALVTRVIASNSRAKSASRKAKSMAIAVAKHADKSQV
ncbi:hypothetical protein BGZ46_003232 [Entomortierella lignicola]|nr:hypothetical protein BGZ46_003232 [Entomortierella lignicola]